MKVSDVETLFAFIEAREQLSKEFKSGYYYLAFSNVCFTPTQGAPASIYIRYPSTFSDSQFPSGTDLTVRHELGLALRNVSGIDTVHVDSLGSVARISIAAQDYPVNRVIIGQVNDYRGSLGSCGSLQEPHGRTKVRNVRLEGFIRNLRFQCADIDLLDVKATTHELALDRVSIDDGSIAVRGDPLIRAVNVASVGDRPLRLSNSEAQPRASQQCNRSDRDSRIDLLKGHFSLEDLRFPSGLAIHVRADVQSLVVYRSSIGCTFRLQVDGDTLIQLESNDYREVASAQIAVSDAFTKGTRKFTADRTGLPPVARWTTTTRQTRDLIDKLLASYAPSSDKDRMGNELKCLRYSLALIEGDVPKFRDDCDPFRIRK